MKNSFIKFLTGLVTANFISAANTTKSVPTKYFEEKNFCEEFNEIEGAYCNISNRYGMSA